MTNKPRVLIYLKSKWRKNEPGDIVTVSIVEANYLIATRTGVAVEKQYCSNCGAEIFCYDRSWKCDKCGWDNEA